MSKIEKSSVVPQKYMALFSSTHPHPNPPPSPLKNSGIFDKGEGRVGVLWICSTYLWDRVLGGCPRIAIFSKIKECSKKLPQAYG